MLALIPTMVRHRDRDTHTERVYLYTVIERDKDTLKNVPVTMCVTSEFMYMATVLHFSGQIKSHSKQATTN